MSELERHELACRQRDASSIRQAFARLWRTLTAQRDVTADPMERAKLACQMQDAAAIRDGVAAVSHIGQRGTADDDVAHA